MEQLEPVVPARQPGAAELRIALLGVPDISRRGRPLPLARRQARALLYRLAAVPAPVRRDELCRLLAPDGRPGAARPLLSVLLTYLRRALQVPGALRAVDDAVALDAGIAWTDTACYESDVRAARSGGRLDLLARAVELYRGPFLCGAKLGAGPAWEDWAGRERERWERRYLEELTTLADGYAALGAYAAAIDYARRVLAVDSLHEEGHRRLMLLYARSGQRTLALRQYESCAALLRSELGVAPVPETRAAFEAIRDGSRL